MIISLGVKPTSAWCLVTQGLSSAMIIYLGVEPTSVLCLVWVIPPYKHLQEQLEHFVLGRSVSWRACSSWRANCRTRSRSCGTTWPTPRASATPATTWGGCSAGGTAPSSTCAPRTSRPSSSRSRSRTKGGSSPAPARTSWMVSVSDENSRRNTLFWDGDSSVVRAPDSRLKGPGFKSL